MLEAIVRHGTPAQRDWAVGTLSLDTSFRTTRAQAQLVSAPSRSAAPVPARVTGILTPRRTVYDASTGSLPGRLARAEGAGPTGDASVDRAYDGLGETYGFYADLFDRDSIDDRGMPLVASVHVGDHWDNAQWDGEQMQFGDGDGELFGDFTASLDVIAHELTHGVTQFEAQLVYQGQSGALNESVSDVFGVLVKQRALGQTAEQADWLIGEDLLLPGVRGTALRSMAAPGTAYDDERLGGRDPQPGHMDDYVETLADNGGVHINSGIPNRAFHLAALALGGHAWDVAGRVWYAALTDPALSSTARFTTFAQATVRAAAAFDGATEAVRGAWRGVGVAA
nr:M4 family metallopeptidase [Motilibacter aurantiacus]